MSSAKHIDTPQLVSARNPNSNCKCTGPGLCERHGVVKGNLEFRFCSGIGCTPSQCQKHWLAWENGEKPGQAQAVANPLPVGIIDERRTGTTTSSATACVHRGEQISSIGCGSCGGGVALKIFACALHEECCIGKTTEGIRSCSTCPDRKPPAIVVPGSPIITRTIKGYYGHPFAYDPDLVPEMVTTARYMDDVKALASQLPPDTARIVGVARSGLCAATMVSMLIHRPLSIVRQSTHDVIDGGNGWRLTGNAGGDGPVIVIDDTCMTGNSFKHIMPIVRAQFPNATSAAVYVNPNARVKPDQCVRELRWPHLLEWNLFNSIVTPQMAVDFDGILCRDCGPGDDDDGPRYARFLESAIPLYYVRKVTIPLIITARLEKYRSQTLAWLARHGMAVGSLIMWPGTNHHERNRSDVGGWKGEHFKTFMKSHRRIQPAVFVESDPRQAQRIAEVSGGIVACPAAGRCFSGRQP